MTSQYQDENSIDVLKADVYPALPLSKWSALYEVEQLTPTAWYKADAITGKNDGDSVTSWLDSSGNGRTLTGAAGATYKAAPFANGLPMLLLDGVDDGFDSGAVELSTVLSGAGMKGSVFVIFYATDKTSGLVAPDYPFAQDGNVRSLAFQGASQGLSAQAIDGGGPDVAQMAAGSCKLNTMTCGLWTYDGTNVKCYSNDIDGPTSAASGAQASTTGIYRIGRGTATGFLTGYIGEVIIFGSALSAGNLRIVAAYLAQKWGNFELSAPTTRVRWRTAFSGQDTTVANYVPLMSLAHVYMGIERWPEFYSGNGLSNRMALTSQASLAALASNDWSYFEDSASGYMYVTTAAAPLAINTHYVPPDDVDAIYKLSFKSSDVVSVPTIESGYDPAPSQPRVNGALVLTDHYQWFFKVLDKYRWRGAPVNFTASRDGTDFTHYNFTCLIDNVVPAEQQCGITFAPTVQYGRYTEAFSGRSTVPDFDQPVPPNTHGQQTWPFAASDVGGLPAQIGVDTQGYGVTTTPDLVSATQATPMDIVQDSTDFLVWIDPATAPRGSLVDGSQVYNIGNKAYDLYGATITPNGFCAVTNSGPYVYLTQPVQYQEDVVNGYPAFYFPGSPTTGLGAGPSIGVGLGSLTTKTWSNRLLVFVVYKLDYDWRVSSNGMESYLFISNVTAGTVTGNRHWLFLNPATNRQIARYKNNAGTNVSATGKAVTAGQWAIATYEIDRGALLLYNGRNNTDTASMSSVGITSTENVTGYVSFGVGIKGYIAEAILLDNKTSAVEHTQDSRRRVTKYLKDKFNIADDASAAPTFTTRGTYHMFDGGKYNGKDFYLDVSSATISATAVNKTTNARVALTAGTDYRTYGSHLTVINSTYDSASYFIETTLANILNAGGTTSYSDEEALFAALTQNYVYPYGQASTWGYLDAEWYPSPIWSDQQTTLGGICAGSGNQPGIFPTTLSRYGHWPRQGERCATLFPLLPTASLEGTKDGTGYTASLSWRRQDFATFAYSGALSQPYTKVRLHYGPKFARGNTRWSTVTAGTGENVLEVYCFLQPFNVAITSLSTVPTHYTQVLIVSPLALAQRHLELNSTGVKQADLETRSLTWILSTDDLPFPGRAIALTMSPFADVVGAGSVTAKQMLVERVTYRLDVFRIDATLSDYRGMGQRSREIAPTAQAWSTATYAQKRDYAFYADPDGRIDSADRLTNSVNEWW